MIWSPIGNFSSGKPAWNAERADPGQIGGDRENIGQIHVQRIGRALTEFEGRLGRSRRNERIHFLESARKILPDKRPHFLRPHIIGLVIAGAQNIGAENDPAFHFRAETFRPRPAVMIQQVRGFSDRYP